MTKQPFVVDGPERIRASQEFQQKKAQIEKRVREKYAIALAQAPWWKTFFLYLQQLHELNQELKKLIPPQGLYFSSQDLHQRKLNQDFL